MLDVRQAEVARGQAQVGCSRPGTVVTIDKAAPLPAVGVLPGLNRWWRLLSRSFRATSQVGARFLLSEGAIGKSRPRGVRGQSRPHGRRAIGQVRLVSQHLLSAAGRATPSRKPNSDFWGQARAPSGTPTTGCVVHEPGNARVFASTQLNCAPIPVHHEPGASRYGTGTAIRSVSPSSRFGALTWRFRSSDQFQTAGPGSQASAQTEDASERVRARELQGRTDVSQAYLRPAYGYQTVKTRDNKSRRGSGAAKRSGNRALEGGLRNVHRADG